MQSDLHFNQVTHLLFFPLSLFLFLFYFLLLNQTHNSGVASAMLYCLSYRKTTTEKSSFNMLLNLNNVFIYWQRGREKNQEMLSLLTKTAYAG